MSTLIMTRSAPAADLTLASHRPVPEPEPPHSSSHLPRISHNAEFPESAVRVLEAPEAPEQCQSEAPEAGGGPPACIERGFTHGRSQS
jgi:hypothetical protein